MRGHRTAQVNASPGDADASAREEKLNKNSVLNALAREDLDPLRRLYIQKRDALANDDRKTLEREYLANMAVMPDGQPVLRHMTSSQFSRLFSEKQLQLPRRQRSNSKRKPEAWADLKRLASHLCDKPPAPLDKEPTGHPFYHAWLERARSGEHQQESMRRIVAGTYLMFRPSVVFPGRYVIGLLIIYRTADKAVATYELNRLDAGGSAPGPLKIEEEHHGYALRKSGTLLIRSWEESSGEEQTGVFSLLNDDHPKYTHVLDGHYLGVLSTSAPTSRPAVLLRQGDLPAPLMDRSALAEFLSQSEARELIAHVGIVAWSDMPLIVQARLSRAAGSLAIYDVPRAP